MKTNINYVLALAVIMSALGGGTVGLGQPTTTTEDPMDDQAMSSVVTHEELTQRVTELTDVVVELRAQVRALQEQLAGISNDPAILQSALGQMSKDPNLLETYGRASQGKLNIHNYRGEPTEIFVNGARWSARVNESHIFVPVGRVTIHEGRYLGIREPVTIPISDWQPQEDGTMELTYRIER